MPETEKKAAPAAKEETKMEKIVSLSKRRGFIYQGSEIYGGLAGTWDFGPHGVALKNNIKNLWWKRFVEDREDMYGVDAAILMNQNVWKASGHVATFSDPLVEDMKTKKRYRADSLLEQLGHDPKGMTDQQMDALIKEKKLKSPDGNPLGDVGRFNMMFKTHVGAQQTEESVSYLRPETAQGMFVNFKNVKDSFNPKLPFGLAQIGKAFRNEIAPRDFIFRLREFEQMEIEYFVDPRDPKRVNEIFDVFFDEQQQFLKEIGLNPSKIYKVEVPDADRAHYSKRSIDTEFDFPFGQKELLGLAYRTDYDLKAHSEASKVDLSYFDEETKERFIPHCIEPTFGVDRLMLAVLSDAYSEEEMPVEAGAGEGKSDEKRVYLKFSPKVAPVKVAVFPLLKNKPVLVEKARALYSTLKKELSSVGVHGIEFDDNGNIGKRYRRQDEIGTPFCVTVDFDTIEQGTGVTVRNRDTGKQERMSETDLTAMLKKELAK
ncbi:MAG: glycyl tRNA synthetase [Candidatus Taylorbacteria bacterium]|nr:glycyl tRNA synthetase [Candidatus Taylorbacteria bacterium]